MNNRELKREAIWIAFVLFCSFLLSMFILPRQRTLLTDLLLPEGVKPSSFNVISYSQGVGLFFQAMFVTLLIRVMFRRFKSRGQIIYLAFVSVSAFLMSTAAYFLVNRMAEVIYGGWRFNPTYIVGMDEPAMPPWIGFMKVLLICLGIAQVITMVLCFIFTLKKDKAPDID